LYYHVLGTDQSEDVLVYEHPEHPEWSTSIGVTRDGDFMYSGIYRDTDPVNKMRIAKVKDGALPLHGTIFYSLYLILLGKFDWIKIKDDFDSGLSYVANSGNIFYFESNLNAPKGSLVRYDLDHPVRHPPLSELIESQEKGFITVIPEQKTAVLETVNLANEKYFVLTYLHNVQSKLFILPLESAERMMYEKHSTETSSSEWIGLGDAEQVKVPVGCNIVERTTHRNDPNVFFRCVGFTFPGRIYRYKFHDSETSRQNGSTRHTASVKPNTGSFGTLSVWREVSVKGFQADQWIVEQVWVPNPNDGVKIPMFIVRDKNLVKTGDSFCLLYG
jgi:prolyl oligopeptidase